MLALLHAEHRRVAWLRKGWIFLLVKAGFDDNEQNVTQCSPITKPDKIALLCNHPCSTQLSWTLDASLVSEIVEIYRKLIHELLSVKRSSIPGRSMDLGQLRNPVPAIHFSTYEKL